MGERACKTLDTDGESNWTSNLAEWDLGTGGFMPFYPCLSVSKKLLL